MLAATLRGKTGAQLKEMTMKTRLAATACLGGLLLAGAAQAAELAPMAAKSIKLGPVTGTAYYMVEADGYRVVATVASGEDAMPVRFVTTLLSGQRTLVSVPGPVGGREQVLEFRRLEDRVFVSEAAKVSALLD